MKKWAFQRVKCLRYEIENEHVDVFENVMHTIPGYVKTVVNPYLVWFGLFVLYSFLFCISFQLLAYFLNRLLGLSILFFFRFNYFGFHFILPVAVSHNISRGAGALTSWLWLRVIAAWNEWAIKFDTFDVRNRKIRSRYSKLCRQSLQNLTKSFRPQCGIQNLHREHFGGVFLPCYR